MFSAVKRAACGIANQSRKPAMAMMTVRAVSSVPIMTPRVAALVSVPPPPPTNRIPAAVLKSQTPATTLSAIIMDTVVVRARGTGTGACDLEEADEGETRRGRGGLRACRPDR